MKKYLLLSFILFSFSFFVQAQRLLSWTPEFPLDNSTVVITGDAAKGNQGLLNYEGGASANVYVHVGVITNLSSGPTDWKYTKFTWGTSDPLAHATPLGSNKYSYTITNPRAFFGVPAGETILKITFIFRNAAGTQKLVNSDGSDMYIPVYAAGQYAVRLNLPPFEPRYVPYPENLSVAVGSTVNITGVSSLSSNLTLKLDGTTLNTASAATTISNTPTIATACQHQIMLEGNDGSGIKKDSFSFYIAPTVNVAALPAGVQEGINYLPGNTSATLVLYAPGKTSASVIGDFSNWQVLCANQMNKTPDGNYFWLTVTGLTPGVEYGYQYLVDNTIKIADPYSQKILDPNNDQFISAVTYPNLKPYPTGLTTDLVSVLQTAEPSYPWQVTNFAKPDKKNLMIYELLIRDFTAEHSYQSLIDSIQYIKNLGMNAIELMPINEFDGNESWGYNPAFYFAPDKYYGTKTKLKEFIDVCHQNGIAVILDVVYNHCTGAAPEAKLYWDAANNRPAANNPWLNTVATHPYSVYNDFNHNSAATQYLVKRSLDFWLTEYKVDGFRFDLAKGFSQTVTNTTTVENYDPARVVNLKRYYDAIVANTANAYAILEFLGTTPCQEEQEYAAYGFMLWGNSNNNFAQSTMGYTSSSDLNPMVWSSSARGFNNPAVVGYSESHDEERTMYKNEQFGNVNGSYNVKNLPTALRQEEAAAPFIFMIPGPKMIWQFQERGYDSSINANGGRVNNKPPLWHYMLDPNRRALYNAYGKMISFRLANPAIFNNTSFTYDLSSGLYKVFQIADPAAAGLKVTVVSNTDVTAQTKTVTFQSTGTWKNYISNGTGAGINGATDVTFTITAAGQSITLQPGEYHIYVSVPPCATAAPTVNTPVTYCQNATATALAATGTGLLWYTVSTGGTGSTTAPTPSTTTAGTTTYYVSQNTGSCESPRAAIVVTVNATPAAPSVTTPINYCQNSSAVPLFAPGSGLLWYTTATGGTESTVAPTPSTTATGSTTYYVSQTTATCESPRAAIVVTVHALPAAPGVSTPVAYCQNTTATALTATGTNLTWYTTSTGGTGSTTAPVPSTATPGSTVYYVSQATGPTAGACEGPRSAITVNVAPLPPAPGVVSPITYCQNATAVPFTATGTNLLWYITPTGGAGNPVAPTPSTATIGTFFILVSQTVGNCEGPRSTIVVNIVASTPTPSVPASTVTYCQNATAVPLTATGTALQWYTTATGGTPLPGAPVPSTATPGSVTYYVSQTLSCGEGPRAAIVVNVNATPGAPTVTSPVSYCQNATATALTATGTGLLWYTTATGGTGSTAAPVPTTSAVGSTTYYVSQTTGTCEGPRAAIVVNINATPAAPAVTNPAPYCRNATATALTATGTNLLWYSTATGGTGSTIAPIPSTTTAGSTSYYVSQTTGTCEGPRAMITVTVNDVPAAPAVTPAFTYCQNSPATVLTATGTNLLWYTAATGGTGTAAAPVPSTTTAGTVSYYVSQSNTCGESPRAAIAITVTPTPAAPTNLTVTDLTSTSATITWTGVAGNYYTVEYKVTGAATWTVAATGITATTYTFNALTLGTPYNIRVSANCAPVAGTTFATTGITTSSRNSTITNLRNGFGLKISPDPVQSSAIIDYLVPGSGAVSLSLYTSDGLLLRNLYVGSQNAGQYQLNITTQFNVLSKGLYIIKLRQNSKGHYLKFIKQ